MISEGLFHSFVLLSRDLPIDFVQNPSDIKEKVTHDEKERDTTQRICQSSPCAHFSAMSKGFRTNFGVDVTRAFAVPKEAPKGGCPGGGPTLSGRGGPHGGAGDGSSTHHGDVFFLSSHVL